MLESVQQPFHRSPLHRKCGMLCYGAVRKLLRVRKRKLSAKSRAEKDLPYEYYQHRCPHLPL